MGVFVKKRKDPRVVIQACLSMFTTMRDDLRAAVDDLAHEEMDLLEQARQAEAFAAQTKEERLVATRVAINLSQLLGEDGGK